MSTAKISTTDNPPIYQVKQAGSQRHLRESKKANILWSQVRPKSQSQIVNLVVIKPAAELHLLFDKLASEVFSFSVCGLTIHWQSKQM
jgi:hypothetical protein